MNIEGILRRDWIIVFRRDYWTLGIQVYGFLYLCLLFLVVSVFPKSEIYLVMGVEYLHAYVL